MRDPLTNKTELIATKVTPEARRMLDAIAAKMGMKTYTLLGLLASCMIRFADERHNLSPEMERMATVFDGAAHWPTATNLCTGGARRAEAAVYLYRQKGKQGRAAVLVEPAFFTEAQQTHNVQEILAQVLEACAPTLLERLRRAGRALGTDTLTETLAELCDRFEPDPYADDIRELFADCNRTDYGEEYKYGARYVSRHKTEMDYE